MPLNKQIKKVLVIGSGPIIIGQAAEFDYAGTQACRVLKSEGKEVVLVNSNPATIMTDADQADRTYLEPLNVATLQRIILKEKPDSLLATLGGQTGLNLAVELAESGFLDKHKVRLLGTTVEAIKKAEDREMFKATMEEISEPVIESVVAESVKTALDFAKKVPYPLIIRPAFTMGGTGGGIAHNEGELREIVDLGLRASRVGQVLVEKSVAGWKEIEFEVIRDGEGASLTVCNMENVDPVGIHTGDSVVVAPVQTLDKATTQMLDGSAHKIIQALGIIGGCNVQYALHPETQEYYLIEVNPRVSRSSALASKATGFPIAKVTALLALGYTLAEIATGKTQSGFSVTAPVVDYVVTKYPRWPFDKFTKADRLLGTKMKATGEVMSIGANFASSLTKALRSLEMGWDSWEGDGHYQKWSERRLGQQLAVQDDERLLVVAECLRRKWPIEKVVEVTKINGWFLEKLAEVIDFEEKIKKGGAGFLAREGNWQKAKELGIGDQAIGRWCQLSEAEVRVARLGAGVIPQYRSIDTCRNAKGATNPYFYSVYGGREMVVGVAGGDRGMELAVKTKKLAAKNKKSKAKTVVAIGSGPIRIGQGIEFDYASVHCAWALQKQGYEVAMINNNPETVSTDFDVADRLYFEPLTWEEVKNVLEKEKPEAVAIQFGGQTAIKLAQEIEGAGYKILGTTAEAINAAEDRGEFEALLNKLDFDRPAGRAITSIEEAVEVAQKLTYPVLIRPSYVLGGQGMEIANDDQEIRTYMSLLKVDLQKYPVLIDKYVEGKELEVDAICDGEEVLIPGIMEHLERSGVHSGDSISLYPAQSLFDSDIEKLVEMTKKLAVASGTVGMINIQFIFSNCKFYIIEINPRSSRTVPYISKVTGLPVVELAVRAALGEKIGGMGYGTGLFEPSSSVYAIKVPVFSNEKLPELEISLSPEMKSTGEVLGLSHNMREALMKGFVASGVKIDQRNDDRKAVLLTVKDCVKPEAANIAQSFERLGFKIFATGGTATFLQEKGVEVEEVGKINEGSEAIIDLIKNKQVEFIINIPTKGRDIARDGFKIRRAAIEQGIVCLTSIDTAKALMKVLQLRRAESELGVMALQDLIRRE